jgi:hypothetical protein
VPQELIIFSVHFYKSKPYPKIWSCFLKSRNNLSQQSYFLKFKSIEKAQKFGTKSGRAIGRPERILPKEFEKYNTSF